MTTHHSKCKKITKSISSSFFIVETWSTGGTGCWMPAVRTCMCSPSPSSPTEPTQSGQHMDEWTMKPPNPKFRLYFKIYLLTLFAALCLTDFIDWRSWLVFSWTVAPMDEGTILAYCCPSTFSLTSPLPKINVQYIQTVCGCGRWGEVMSCVVDHILQKFLHSVSGEIQNLQNCFPTPNKNNQ